MKKALFILCLSLPSILLQAQTFNASGDWISSMPESMPLSIFIHLAADPIAGYKGDWNSLNEQAFGLKCRTVTVINDSLIIETAGVRAFYRGKFASPDSINGVWQQNNNTIPLVLTRARRPQTPAPAAAYRSDSVEYDNAAGTVHLGATLTRPAKGRKFPAVILITGSGQQDRDETIFGHKPFAILSDYLTRRGIAVLRADDRGIGTSRGDLAKATSADFAADVIAGIEFLKTQKDIDTTRIALIGLSEGGLIAPIVYSLWPHLKCMVLLAGPGVAGSEISLRQQTEPVLALGHAAYNAYYPLVREKMTILNDTYGQPDSITIKALKTSFAHWKATLPDSIASALNAKNATPEMYGFQETAEMRPWIRYFYKTDPTTYLLQVRCPVLALNGSKDTQVDAQQNIPAIKMALAHSGAAADTLVFPGLNHLFQHCNTGNAGEYARIEESFAPEVLSAIAVWTEKFLILYK